MRVQKKPYISIIIPTWNEALNIRQLLLRIEKTLKNTSWSYEVLIIDDHSTDNTLQCLEKLTISFPLRTYLKKGLKGKAQSLLEGFSYSQGTYLVMIDADLQYPPEAIPAMVALVKKSRGISVSDRVKHQTSWIRKLTSKSFRWLFGYCLHGLSCDVQSGLKVFHRQCLPLISNSIAPSPWTFDLEFLVQARYRGFSIQSFPIEFAQRQFGETKINIIQAAWEIGTAALGLKIMLISKKLFFYAKQPRLFWKNGIRRLRQNWQRLAWKSMIGVLILTSIFTILSVNTPAVEAKTLWKVQSVDTMKYSRDVAREYANNHSFDQIIEKQVQDIASTGATHIAIGTPYEEEFIPFMKRWVNTARKYDLSVWFRGNAAGWEGWFNYPKINQEQHKQQILFFIENNKDLFETGDIFTSCPECENGGPGDPRQTGDIQGFQNFLIEEHQAVKEAFKKQHKEITTNYYSMNGDVARLVMNPETTAALDGVVTIDHYVKTPEQLVQDIQNIALHSQGRVVLAEFGVPIPDIHGKMSEVEQAVWLDTLLEQLKDVSELEGINYWVSVGGSTELWPTSRNEKLAASVLKRYYSTQILEGVVLDTNGGPLQGGMVTVASSSAELSNGFFRIELIANPSTEFAMTVTAPGYDTFFGYISPKRSPTKIELTPTYIPSLWEKWWHYFISLFSGN